MTLLVLGGTAEARGLAAQLAAQRPNRRVVSSLAGRVSAPALPVGEVRVGGFGGVEGLRRYLQQEQVRGVVDATHPFAERISAHAAAACAQAGVPLLRLQRPGWSDHPDAGRWTWVPDLPAARDAAADARRPFLTTGRQSLPVFAGWADRAVLVRLVEAPDQPLPPAWTLVRSRGPYTPDGEAALLRDHGSDRLITKDSGGPMTAAKLDAAAALGVGVVVVRRPPPPPGVPLAAAVDEAVRTVATWG